MDARTTTSELEILRREWDEHARSARPDAEYYSSGERDLERDILPHIAARGCALEIGCGAGRITRALARAFDKVYTVDVSAGMVARAREALAGCRNVQVFQNDGRSLEMVREPLDIAVAYGVFPHLSREAFEHYAREVCRRLRPGGAFVFEIYAEFEAPLDGYEVRRRERDGRPFDLLWCVRAGPRA